MSKTLAKSLLACIFFTGLSLQPSLEASLAERWNQLPFDSKVLISLLGINLCARGCLAILEHRASSQKAIEVQSPKKADQYLEQIFESAPEQIKELAALANDPEGHNLLPLGYILSGPPGTGKTQLAEAFANKIAMPFYSMNLGEIGSKWVNQTAKEVDAFFARVRRDLKAGQVAVIFIDEIDALTPSRGGHHNHQEDKKTVAAFLRSIQGFNMDNNKRIIVIGSTNNYSQIDAGIQSRLPEITMGLPSREQRLNGLKTITSRLSIVCDDALLTYIADRTEGLSFRDLDGLVKSFARKQFLAKKAAGIETDVRKVFEQVLKEFKQDAPSDQKPLLPQDNAQSLNNLLDILFNGTQQAP